MLLQWDLRRYKVVFVKSKIGGNKVVDNGVPPCI